MLDAIQKLEYRPGDKFAPVVPPQTVVASLFQHVDDRQLVHLEGLIFDRNRDIYYCDIPESIIMKLDMKTREVIKFYEFENKLCKPAAVKIHKDGRLFIACVDLNPAHINENGGIFALDPVTKELEPIVTNMSVNDLVFDSEGGIYFDNYQGTPTNPTGSIEYLTPDFKTQKTVVPNLAQPNGITLSPDEKILWITEITTGLLHRITLDNPNYSTTPYKFEGFFGPDSCEVDEDGNLYVAMARQGRVLVFNPTGFLIGQVLTPMRDQGILLGTTHPYVHPDKAELYITVHDVNGEQGANIFYCGSYAKGNPNAFQYQ